MTSSREHKSQPSSTDDRLSSHADHGSQSQPGQYGKSQGSSQASGERGPAPSSEGLGTQAPTWITRDGYQTITNMCFLTCHPHNLNAGDVATCSVKINPTSVSNLPNEFDGKLYDVTYKNRPPTTRATKNLAVEFLGEPIKSGEDTWQVQIRATEKVYVGPVSAMGGAQIASPVFLESIGDYVSHKLWSGNK
jgi:hypothetical protein